MQADRPFVMSVAGFDPSGGAGILADIKCFEQCETYGFGICSALTIQTDTEFLKNEWQSAKQIIDQAYPLLQKFNILSCKIGLIENLEVLEEVLVFLKQQRPDIKIVLDPVLKASSGYAFHDWTDGLSKLIPVLKHLNLITPNYPEMKALAGDIDVHEAAKAWSVHSAVLLKGGHTPDHSGTDYLYENEVCRVLKPSITEIYQKHGSGCVLSAAITAELAKGHTLETACVQGKTYIEHFLNSNTSLLGYHKL
jgi:hydroxymethylpyrimidine/phosphomethylpyrimidine kinase